MIDDNTRPITPTRPTQSPNFDWGKCDTPHGDLVKISDYAQYIETRLSESFEKDIPITPSVSRTLSKLNKANTVLALDAVKVGQEMKRLVEVQLERSARKQHTGIAATFGTIKAGGPI